MNDLVETAAAFILMVNSGLSRHPRTNPRRVAMAANAEVANAEVAAVASRQVHEPFQPCCRGLRLPVGLRLLRVGRSAIGETRAFAGTKDVMPQPQGIVKNRRSAGLGPAELVTGRRRSPSTP